MNRMFKWIYLREKKARETELTQMGLEVKNPEVFNAECIKATRKNIFWNIIIVSIFIYLIYETIVGG